MISFIYALLSGILLYLSAMAFNGFWDIKRENPHHETGALVALTVGLLALTISNVLFWTAIARF